MTCAGQHGLFDITSLHDQVLHLIPMRDPRDILFNDRAVVQGRGDVVAGAADHFTPRWNAA
jgi:hypothetical protein